MHYHHAQVHASVQQTSGSVRIILESPIISWLRRKSIMPIASTTHHNTHDKTHPKWAQHQQDSIKICPIISQILGSGMQHCNA